MCRVFKYAHALPPSLSPPPPPPSSFFPSREREKNKNKQDNFKDVAAASEFASAAVAMEAGAADKQGECFVWGTGDAGQLGMGDDIFELSRPRLLSTLPSATPVLKVVCGGMHTVAIVQGGLVYSWGVNDEGALGRKANKDDENAESTPGLVTIPGSAAAVDISTGDSHVAVATSDGAVVAWGTFRTSSGLWAFTPTTQIAKTPVQCYTPDSHSVRPMTCYELNAVEQRI